MHMVRDAAGLRRELASWRRQGDSIGFVPTMGALHQGHLSLVELARGRARRVVASVFVNPTQFGPGEDFDLYPRQLGTDSVLLEAAGCDLLFAPDVETLYPPGHTTVVDPGAPGQILEGERRPGHFRGVATVVSALFQLVRPDVAVFGEKDAQQLAVVRRLVRDLHFGIEIVAGPTVREADGLAMSSRNAYLSAGERRAAAVLHQALQAAAAAIEGGERRGDEVRRILRQVVEEEPLAHLEYGEVVDAESFQPVATLAGRVVLPIAAHVGRTRLIDNVQLAAGEQPAAGAVRRRDTSELRTMLEGQR
ncbi:MAG: pantoate--beta-alanine ligase [Acidobacteria bacterium]|nr:pantoate--beta-alanine ligase [Acidobacteriota bacterium]